MLKIKLILIVIIFSTIISGAQSQIVEIESTTQGFLPPRMTTAQRGAIASPSNGLMIFNTSTGRLNYYDAGWLELYPDSHADSDIIIDYILSLPNGAQMLLDAGETIQTLLDAGMTLQSLLNMGITPLTLINAGALTADFIGLNYEGGIIFYIRTDGSGLIAASTDQSTGTEWGCRGTLISGADGLAIGTGSQNTMDIEAGCSTNGTAADICANLVLNGFDDWFLPSRDELEEMYLKIGQGAGAPNTNIGGFTDSVFGYFSSSELNATDCYSFSFVTGNPGSGSKDFGLRYVRAIRSFN